MFSILNDDGQLVLRFGDHRVQFIDPSAIRGTVAHVCDLSSAGVLFIADDEAAEILKICIQRVRTYPDVARAIESYLSALLPDTEASFCGGTT